MLIKSVDETQGIHPRTRRFQFPAVVRCLRLCINDVSD
jgi:hypothetical protein